MTYQTFVDAVSQLGYEFKLFIYQLVVRGLQMTEMAKKNKQFFVFISTCGMNYYFYWELELFHRSQIKCNSDTSLSI